MNRYIGETTRDNSSELPESFEAWQAEALAQDCSEALVREWSADIVVQTHSHHFDAEAVVVRREMWLTEGDRTRHLTRGGTFRIPAGTPHAERYGAEGATFWVSRRHIDSNGPGSSR